MYLLQSHLSTSVIGTKSTVTGIQFSFVHFDLFTFLSSSVLPKVRHFFHVQNHRTAVLGQRNAYVCITVATTVSAYVFSAEAN